MTIAPIMTQVGELGGGTAFCFMAKTSKNVFQQKMPGGEARQILFA